MKKVAFLFVLAIGLAVSGRTAAQVFIHASIGIPLPPPPPRPVVYYEPAPRPVYYAPAPRPVYYAPAPRPVYCEPVPVCRPRYYGRYNRPVVVVRDRRYRGGRW